MKSNELKETLDIWAEIFEQDDMRLVTSAVKSLIQHLEFPPTIADVKKEMSRLVGSANDEDLAVDEWNQIRQAIRSSAYYSKENFYKLPEIAKRFVGSPQQLKDWATSEDFNAEVVKGQFFKQYDNIKERKKYEAMLNQNELFKELVSNITNPKVLEEKNEEKVPTKSV